MRTRPGPVLLWLTATVTAIVVASIAISQVGRQITLETPIDEQLAQAVSGDVEAAPPDDAPPAVTTPDEPESDQPDTVPPDVKDDDPAAVETAPVEVRTYDTIGGSAAVAISGGAVEVRWATPRDGFRVSVSPSHAGRELRIDFRSDAHRSRIKVELLGDRVVDEIDEIDEIDR